MQSRFADDFGDVRLHDDSTGHAIAGESGARAVTVGSHIFLKQGSLPFAGVSGVGLIAHELAHVVQQRRGAGSSVAPGAAHEQSAEAAADAALGRGPVHVAGSSGVGVARAPDDDAAKREEATKRIATAKAALDRLEAEKNNPAKTLAVEDSQGAYDAVNAALRHAGKSGDPDLTKQAESLRTRFQSVTRGTSLEHRVTASDAPLDPAEGHRVVTAQRGFEAGLSAGKLKDQEEEIKRLQEQEAALGAGEERTKLREKIATLQRRRAISMETQGDPIELASRKSDLIGRIALEKDAGRKARLQSQLDVLNHELSSYEGGRLGHSGSTYVTIQVVSPEGKVVATVQARNRSGRGDDDPGEHAEPIALRVLANHPNRDQFKGARLVVTGDQEVCDKCHPQVAAFARDHGFATAVGRTTSAPTLRTAGSTTPTLATAKTTAGKLADPAAIAKLETEQRRGGVIGPTESIHLTPVETTLYTSPGTQGGTGSAAKADTAAGPGSTGSTTATTATTATTKTTAAPLVKQETAATSVGEPQLEPDVTASGGQGQTKTTTPKPTPATPDTATGTAKTTVKSLAPPTASKDTEASQETSVAPAVAAKGVTTPVATKTVTPPPVKVVAPPPTETQTTKTVSPPLVTQSTTTSSKPTPNQNVNPPTTKTGTPTTHTPEASTDAGRGGVSRYSSVGANGRAIARAEEIPGSSPPRYRVTLGINLGANVGAGVSRQSGGVETSAGLSASGELTATFSQELSATEAEKYLADVRTGSLGTYRELRLVQLARDSDLAAARAYYQQIQGTTKSLEGAGKLKEGQAIDLSAQGRVGANVGAGGTVGEGGAIGAHVGVFTTGRIERKVEARGGKIVVTIRVLNEQGYAAGGSAGYGIASLGYTREASEGKSRGATFVFDPNDRSQADRYQQVTAVTTEEELRKLSGPGGPTETTEGRTSTTGATTDATVLGAGIRFRETGTLGKEETRDASGQVVRTTYTGSGTGGASLIVGGKQGPGSEQRDAISATVAQGKGGGEASRTRIETDYGKTVSRLSEHPVDVLVGAATGASPLLQETQNTQGKLLTDDSYVAIAEAAKNEGKWIATLAGNGSLNVNIDDWRKTRHKVLAANGDRAKIAEALSEYYAGGSGRGKAVEAIVGSTGIGFEFPDKLADQQPTYNDLMVGDPLSRSRELSAAGDRQGAIADLKSRDDRVKRLASDLAARSTDFEDSKSFLEMQRRLDGRRAQLRNEIQKLTAPTPLPLPPNQATTDQLAAPAAGQKLSKADRAKAEAAQRDAAARADVASRQADATEAERKKGDAAERIQGMAQGVRGARAKEDAVFARVESEYHGSFLGHAYTTTPNLSGTIEIAKAMTDLKKSYEDWDQLIDTMQAVLKEAGGDPSTVDHYRPNRARYRELHQRTFGNPGL